MTDHTVMMEELARVVAFASIVAFVYLFSLRVLGGVIWARLRPKPERRRNLRAHHRVVLALAGLGTVCIFYGYYVEPYWPEITYNELLTPKLAAGTLGLRIVHLSDLHCEKTVRTEEKLPELIRSLKPDLILYTGDSLNHEAGLPVFRQLMTELAKIAPVYGVRGNWDQWYWEKLPLFDGTEVHELQGESKQVTVKGNSVWIGGTPVDHLRSPASVLREVPTNEFRIFLHHYPDEIIRVAEGGLADLYLAGHTHGGQVRLPWYGALVTMSRYGKRFEWGLHQVNQTWLYVSRGVGMEGDSAPRVRFLARPEIAVIDVKPALSTDKIAW